MNAFKIIDTKYTKDTKNKYIPRIFTTKNSPGAIIRNPINNKPYTNEEGECMTVDKCSHLFFRVNKINGNQNNDNGHLYYLDIEDYKYHHNLLFIDENIHYKWYIKNNNNMLKNEINKNKKVNSQIYDDSFVFTQPPWSKKIN